MSPSLFGLFTAGLACVAPFASAWTQPKGDSPLGNAITSPNMGDIVPVGQPYTIKWTPSTQGTVTLLLLKGPSENAVPQYAIVEKIDNSGSYTWTPSTDLVASDAATPAKGYGIQLIDDATGQYQYSTQFGISKSGSSSSSSSSAAAAASSATGTVTTAAAAHPTTGAMTESTWTTYCPESTTLVVNNQTYTVESGMQTLTATMETSAPASAPPATATAPAPYPVGPASNSTMMSAPTGYSSKTSPGSGPSGTSGMPPQSTGAAANVAVSVFGLVAAAGAAVLAF